MRCRSLRENSVEQPRSSSNFASGARADKSSRRYRSGRLLVRSEREVKTEVMNLDKKGGGFATAVCS